MKNIERHDEFPEIYTYTLVLKLYNSVHSKPYEIHKWTEVFTCNRNKQPWHLKDSILNYLIYYV